ncbi:unnamed protein product, partial [Laminaria digitata]
GWSTNSFWPPSAAATTSATAPISRCPRLKSVETTPSLMCQPRPSLVEPSPPRAMAGEHRKRRVFFFVFSSFFFHPIYFLFPTSPAPSFW